MCSLPRTLQLTTTPRWDSSFQQQKWCHLNPAGVVSNSIIWTLKRKNTSIRVNSHWSRTSSSTLWIAMRFTTYFPSRLLSTWHCSSSWHITCLSLTRYSCGSLRRPSKLWWLLSSTMTSFSHRWRTRLPIEIFTRLMKCLSGYKSQLSTSTSQGSILTTTSTCLACRLRIQRLARYWLRSRRTSTTTIHMQSSARIKSLNSISRRMMMVR